ncbi:MAG: spore germination protein, partial [Oscillospiraceae bacterium]|nr:spore germination protein [Oscillospiraceae bacterium]
MEQNQKTTWCAPEVPEGFETLKKSIAENREMLDALFTDVDIMLHRTFENAENPTRKFCVYFSDGVSDSMMLGEHVIKPLILARGLPHPWEGLYEAVRDHVELTGEIAETQDMQEIVDAITYGDTLLLVEGSDTGLIINNKGFNLRGISEPEGEKVLLGPREGFTEGLMTNLSMLRRRLRTHQLKLKMDSLGRQSKTGICVAYMDNIVNKDILGELERRLETIDIDAVLDGGYIAEYIAERSALGFHTIGATERPDVVAGRLLEGRIAIFTDGS